MLEKSLKRKNELNHLDLKIGTNINKPSSLPTEPMVARYTTYDETGVNMSEEQDSVHSIKEILAPLKLFRKNLPGEMIIDIGHFAGVVRLNNTTGLVLCTDGVGTKILVAEMMDKYDTIGIDCVAMNVNDLICVGGEPISMVDYLAMDRIKKEIVSKILIGLKKGAELSNITIAGGEIASIKEMLNGIDNKPHIDLSAMAVGLVPLDKIIDGSKLKPGDKIIALESSGIHSNGLTMARKVLLKKHNVHDWIDSLQTTIGEELLKPTKIYVKEILEIINSTEVHLLAHITSHGISNMDRLGRKYNIGFSIEKLPKPQPIYDFIQKEGPVSTKEMYTTFNMGMGFCVFAPKSEVDDILSITEKYRVRADVIGTTIRETDPMVHLREYNLSIRGKKIGC
jgi:phosphoribosylformylglycinamidine cyclo-ligase